MDNSEMIVDRRDILQAIRSLQDAARGKNPPDLELHSEAGHLVVQVGDTKSRIPGNRSLPGRASASRACWSRSCRRCSPTRRKFPSPGLMTASISARTASAAAGRIRCLQKSPSRCRKTGWRRSASGKKYSLGEIGEMGYKQRYESALQERDRRISQAS